MNLRDATLTTLETPALGWGLPKGMKFAGTHSTKRWPFIVELYFVVERYLIQFLKRLGYKVSYEQAGYFLGKKWFKVSWASIGVK